MQFSHRSDFFICEDICFLTSEQQSDYCPLRNNVLGGESSPLFTFCLFGFYPFEKMANSFSMPAGKGVMLIHKSKTTFVFKKYFFNLVQTRISVQSIGWFYYTVNLIQLFNWQETGLNGYKLLLLLFQKKKKKKELNLQECLLKNQSLISFQNYNYSILSDALFFF